MSCMRGEKKSRLYAAVQPASPPAEPPAVVQYGLAIALGVVLGCILGLAQSMVLRRYTARAGRGIWANALAWAVGMPLIFVGMDLVPWSRGTVVIIVAIYGVCWATGLVVGAVHGWALVSLAPPAPELRPHNKARPPGPGEAPNVVQDGTPSLGRLRAEKMPASYRRVIITQPGGPEVLQILEEALPEPGPGEVRVRIVTAG